MSKAISLITHIAAKSSSTMFPAFQVSPINRTVSPSQTPNLLAAVVEKDRLGVSLSALENSDWSNKKDTIQGTSMDSLLKANRYCINKKFLKVVEELFYEYSSYSPSSLTHLCRSVCFI